MWRNLPLSTTTDCKCHRWHANNVTTARTLSLIAAISIPDIHSQLLVQTFPSVYQAVRRADQSAQRRLIARAEEIGRNRPELPVARQRTFLTALIERIDVRANRIDIHLRPIRLSTLLDIAATPLPSETDEAQVLSVPIWLRRSGRETKMLASGLRLRADCGLRGPHEGRGR